MEDKKDTQAFWEELNPQNWLENLFRAKKFIHE